MSARDESENQCLTRINDYVQKPFSTAELMATCATLRQQRGDNKAALLSTKIKIDYVAHSVYLDGEEVHLTNYEYKSFAFLLKTSERRHAQFYYQSMGPGGNDANGLSIYITKKIEKTSISGVDPHRCGAGYRMNKI
ncbi:MAG: response regulator transcription factor [Christensenellaceae bacterium]